MKTHGEKSPARHATHPGQLPGTRLMGWLGLALSVLGSDLPLVAPRGMVVSSHRLASEAGVQVLQAGGNAVDAAVATGLALAVTHPSAGNLGGGGFMVLRMADGRTAALDFRETAPMAARTEMYLGIDGQLVPGSNHAGFRAVGVPGTVAGFDLALKRYGTRSWRELTQTAVTLADAGFPLTPALAHEFAALKSAWLRHPASAAVFLKPDGSTYQVGETWRQPDLARTLRRLQEKGRDGFYRGETARLLAEEMKRHDGLITRSDLAHYRALSRTPVRGKYRGLEIISMPPPSSGGTAIIEMLNVLESFDLKALGHDSPAYIHLLAETMRRAFADRARFLGDPDVNPGMPSRIKRLTSKPYAAQLAHGIRPDAVSMSDASKLSEIYESPHTTHYSVIDAAGNSVVVTYTLEESYGSRLVADGLGFLLNNEMGDFNPQPGRTDSTGLIGTSPNLIRPGHRMLSSMSPTILLRDGRPWLLIGSPGGRTIINTVLQVILNSVDFQQNLSEAIGAGRIHHQWLPDELVVEPGVLTAETRLGLERLGHRVRVGETQGRAMGIAVEPVTGKRTGVADPRDPDGAAAGY